MMTDLAAGVRPINMFFFSISRLAWANSRFYFDIFFLKKKKNKKHTWRNVKLFSTNNATRVVIIRTFPEQLLSLAQEKFLRKVSLRIMDT